MSDAAKVITEHIRAEYMDGKDVELTEDLNLIDEGILDSLGIFLVVEFTQDRFGISIEPDEVTIDNFENIGAMARLVDGKLAAR